MFGAPKKGTDHRRNSSRYFLLKSPGNVESALSDRPKSSSSFFRKSWKKIVPTSSPLIPSEEESLTTAIPKTHSQLCQILIQIASTQIDQYGKTRVAPDKRNWKTLFDYFPIFDEYGTFLRVEETELEFPLFDGEWTSVFPLKCDPSRVVRYHLHCFSNMCPMDPTVVDYWFLKRLKSTGIVPKAYYFSAAMDPNTYDEKGKRTIEAGEGKTRRHKSDAAGVRPALRYAILERVGMNIHQYISSQPDQRVPFADAIRLGGQMIDLAEQLHAYNIMHGDAHMGNFAIHNGRIIMIDFGRAKIMSPTEISDRHSFARSSYWISPRISPWEMQHYILSYRDDVYRILHGMASAIHGDAYSEYMQHVCHPERKAAQPYAHILREHVIEMKLTGKIFEIPRLDTTYFFPPDMTTSFSLDGLVPAAVIDEVRRLLTESMEEVLRTEIFNKPNYTVIRQKFIEILNLVEGSISNPDDPFHMTFTTPTSPSPSTPPAVVATGNTQQ